MILPPAAPPPLAVAEMDEAAIPANLLLYYSGVAQSVAGENFLIPIDAAKASKYANSSRAMRNAGALSLRTIGRWLVGGANGGWDTTHTTSTTTAAAAAFCLPRHCTRIFDQDRAV